MDKKSKIIIVILSILVLAMGGYIAYDLGKSISNKKAEQKEEKEKQQEDKKDLEQDKEEPTGNNSVQNSSEEKPLKCTGTYYGESSGTYASGISYDYKYEYKLYEDGTYEFTPRNAGGEKGTYTIANNTITFTYTPIGAPVTEKATKTLTIASDCSYITESEGFNLYRK